MKTYIVAALLLCLGAESAWAEFKNYEAPGNLESKNDLDCVGPEKLSNKYTPADLYKALSKCAKDEKYKEGALLFALAGVYGRFDTFRVADKTAHQAVRVLLMQAFSGVDADKQEAFKSSLKSNLGAPDELAAVCKKIIAIGSPDYYPRYMVQHGIEAFTKERSGDGLVADFETKLAWKRSLDTYLHCPDL